MHKKTSIDKPRTSMLRNTYHKSQTTFSGRSVKNDYSQHALKSNVILWLITQPKAAYKNAGSVHSLHNALFGISHPRFIFITAISISKLPPPGYTVLNLLPGGGGHHFIISHQFDFRNAACLARSLPYCHESRRVLLRLAAHLFSRAVGVKEFQQRLTPKLTPRRRHSLQSCSLPLCWLVPVFIRGCPGVVFRYIAVYSCCKALKYFAFILCYFNGQVLVSLPVQAN